MAGPLPTDDIRQHFAGYPLFRGHHDLEETRHRVGEVYRPHQLGVVGPHRRLNAQMDHLRLQRVSLSRLRYDSPVTITSEPLTDFLLVMMPLAGSAEVSHGGERVVTRAGDSAVVDASKPLSMRWDEACEQLIVRIEWSALQAACTAYLGDSPRGPLRFALGMDLGSSASAAWRAALTMIAADAGLAAQLQHTALLRQQIEHLLISALLTAQPNSYREQLLAPTRAPAPFFVKRAEDYLAAHCDEAVSMEALARHAGVSLRSLYAGFQKFRQTTPMAALKALRLERVRQALLEARRHGEPVTVSAVALQWGFGHLGHFTQAYQARYGELPSHTLRGAA